MTGSNQKSYCARRSRENTRTSTKTEIVPLKDSTESRQFLQKVARRKNYQNDDAYDYKSEIAEPEMVESNKSFYPPRPSASKKDEKRKPFLSLHRKAISSDTLLGTTSNKTRGHRYFFGGGKLGSEKLDATKKKLNSSLFSLKGSEDVDQDKMKSISLPRGIKTDTPATPRCTVSRRSSSHSVKETKVITISQENIQAKLSEVYQTLAVESLEGMINQYAIIKPIGEGSFSRVYLVYNIEDSRFYACKAVNKKRLRKKNLWKNGPPRRKQGIDSDCKVHSRSSTGESTQKVVDYMDCIRKEIAIMKRLSKHPHIVTLTEVLDDENQDTLYLGTD